MMNAISPQCSLSPLQPCSFNLTGPSQGSVSDASQQVPQDGTPSVVSDKTGFRIGKERSNPAKTSKTKTSKTKTSKTKIATHFGQAAQSYHTEAQLQRQCAEQLLILLDQSLARSPSSLPPGPILEIGCGTGFITQRLIERFCGRSMDRIKDGSGDDSDNTHPSFPRHSLHITDLSPDMVAFCQRQIESQIESQIATLALLPSSVWPIAFEVLDAENSPALPQTYSLIIGGFVAQWFKRLEDTVAQLLQQLKPGGRLLLSFPGDRSFPEWREQCDRLHLPFTAHPLPNPHTLIQHLQLSSDQYDLRIDMQPTYYPSAKDFFKSMKVIGAGGSDSGYCLSLRQMRQLLREWRSPITTDGNPVLPQIEVHYEVVYLSILKVVSPPLAPPCKEVGLELTPFTRGD